MEPVSISKFVFAGSFTTIVLLLLLQWYLFLASYSEQQKFFSLKKSGIPTGVGLGGKVEDSLLAIKKVTNTSSSTTAAAPKVTKPTLLSFEKRRFGNHTNARASAPSALEHLETILNILETKSVAGRAITIEPQKFPPRVHLQAKQFRPKPLVVFGISTISRGSEEHSYLRHTLTSLRNHLKKDERSQCLFVIQVAEVGNHKKGLKMVQNVNKSFHQDIEEGLIEVILVNKTFYPSISVVSKTNETRQRVYWRTKQNLDMIYLMAFASQKEATFYVHLEDDIVTRPGYFGMLKSFALQKYSEKMDSSNSGGGKTIPWVFLDFCPLGFIGKLFVSSELSDFIQYLSVFYNDWPCDWLLATYTRTRACPFTMKTSLCAEKAKQYGIAFKEPLFQHTGYHSSLQGKISKEKLRRFPKN